MNISVALATYNGERYLREQLDSIARQTLLPSEIVVGDDGSKDRTVEILEEFARDVPFAVRVQCNPKQLRHEDNFLSTASRCQGEVIAFCDQDDVWDENKLARCAVYFQNPENLLLLHSARVVDASLNYLNDDVPTIPKTRIAPPLQVNPWHSAPGFAMLFSARLIHQYDWHDRPGELMAAGRPLGHDHWVYLMASVLGNIVFLSEHLGVYRRHENNVTTPLQHGTHNNLRQTKETGAGAYEYQSGLALERAQYLERLLAQAESQDKDKFLKGVNYYREWADKLALRAVLHSEATSRYKRLACLTTLLRRKVYQQSRDWGGFGMKSLVKDTVSAVTGR